MKQVGVLERKDYLMETIKQDITYTRIYVESNRKGTNEKKKSKSIEFSDNVIN